MERKNTLYEQSFEHDNCGIGAVVNIDGSQSRKIVDNALSIVEKLEHRAGKDAAGETGDGVGILLQISHSFFTKVAGELKVNLGSEGDYGIGMFFFPSDLDLYKNEKNRFEEVLKSKNLEILAWRDVPVSQDVLGKKARDCMPKIMQCFIKRPENVNKGLDFDRILFEARRVFEKNGKSGSINEGGVT